MSKFTHNAWTLSEYGGQSAHPSPVNAMMAAFAEDFRDGVDINLGVGYVNERTIPKAEVQEAAAYVLAHPEEHRQPLNYGGAVGSPTLVRALRQVLPRLRHGAVPEEVLAQCEVIVGANGVTSLLDGVAQVLPPGIVLTSDPMYYIYTNTLERRDFELVAATEDDEGLDIETLRGMIARLGDRVEAVRFIYAVTVSNPGCAVLSNERRRALVALAEELTKRLGRPVPLILDKAYEFLVHDPAMPPLESMHLYDTYGLVYEVNSLSKILAPGLRIGYLTGPDSPFLRALVQYASDSGFSASLFTQEIASRLLDTMFDAQVERVNTAYRAKARQVQDAIERHLGDYIEHCAGGRAGFYYYLTFRGIPAHEGSSFFNFLARTTGDPAVDGPQGGRYPRVIYLPGSFCVHPQGSMAEVGQRQARISYGFEEPDRIAEALEYMHEAAEYARARRP